MKPLYQVQNQAGDLQWDENCARAFEEAKSKMQEAPVLAYARPDLPFIIDADASQVAIGAVLSQVLEGKERVIAYFSRCLSRPERNYCVTRKELLGVVEAVRAFHHYGLDNEHKLVIRTDHSSLRWLMNFKMVDGQLARWMESLATYRLDIQYRRGATHGNADGLSRRPCVQSGCKYCDRRESWAMAETTDQARSVRALGNCKVVTVQPQPLRERQLADSHLLPVIQWLEDGKRPIWDTRTGMSATTRAYWAMWDSLLLDNGILHRCWESPDGSHVRAQVVVPQGMQREVFTGGHEPAHLGEKRTLSLLRSKFYWVGMHQDVRNWCRSCEKCGRRRGGQKAAKAPLQPSSSGYPFQRVAIDVFGPLPLTEKGNRYVLTVVDFFTKWPEAIPLPNQQAETVAQALLEHVVSRFGVPEELHSDQGRNFESALFQDVLKQLGINKTRTTALHPQSDGMVERLHRTLYDWLSKMVQDHQRDWDAQLPVALLAYRASEHSVTGYTPSYLMFGRELMLPLDLLFGRHPDEKEMHEFALDLKRRLSQAHEAARESLKLRAEDMKCRYDLKTMRPKYQVGDKVWLHNPRRMKGRNPKLQCPWDGPYTVIKRLNDVVYRLRSIRGAWKVVHADRLTLYCGVNLNEKKGEV